MFDKFASTIVLAASQLLPVERMRSIMEQDRAGRVVVHCVGVRNPTQHKPVRFGTVSRRFQCGGRDGRCENILAIGDPAVVSKMLYLCVCGALCEVPGAEPPRRPPAPDQLGLLPLSE